MEFIVGLPRTVKGHTVIWVILDRLTKSAHFIPGKSTYLVNKWTQMYMKEVVRLHEVLVFDRDPRLMSNFWKSLQSTLDTQLEFNITF